MKKIIFICLSLIGLIACDKEQQWEIDDKVINQYIADNNLEMTLHSSGLYYQIITKGNTTKPTYTSVVSVKYKGYLTDGTIFDDSKGKIKQFYLGNQVVPGWQYGLPLIDEGGKIKIILPSSLGYGGNATGVIPANSVTIFEIELILVQ